ncbi:MAG: hypothetical protein E7402_00595 [Ruminococcaceae bacterium]|nr:hypothetical protein [Oscillospiraceae bacterium]
MGKKISFSAMAMALSIICLYGASILPTGRLVTLALASLFCAVVSSQYGVRYGITVYIGTSLMALLFIHRRTFVYAYVLFAGYYPIVKLYIEKMDRLLAEWLVKMLFFNSLLVVFYIVFKTVFAPSATNAVVLLVLQYLGPILVGLEAVFVIYDIALSYMVSYYHQFLRRIRHE